jgi:hypothetical protein
MTQQKGQVALDEPIRGMAADGIPILLVHRNEAIMRVERDLKNAILQRRAERKGINRAITSSDLDSLSLATVDTSELIAGMDRAFEESKRRDKPTDKQVPTYELLTPANVIGGFVGFQPIIDELLNRADALATSQLFAMRTHITATIADLNVVFRTNLNDAYANLSALQKDAFSRAQVMLSDTNRALNELQATTFREAANLICDTSVSLANFPIKLISINLFQKKVIPPDIVCLRSPDVRDAGTLHEQLLKFRGVNLNPNEEYPQATLTIPSQPQYNYSLSTAGGNTVILMPLPGGLNGTHDDLKLRGDLVAQVDFNWAKANKLRRWFFILKPFLVRSIEVSITPLLEQTTYSTKTDSCYVNSEGGRRGGKEVRRTCLITVDDQGEAISCSNSGPTTQNGDSGIENGPLQGPGSCEWGVRAQSSFLGAGAWYGMFIYMNQKSKSKIRGTTYRETFIMNQGNLGQVINYDPKLIPGNARTMDDGWEYTVTITDNTGNRYVLTETKPGDPKIGSAQIDQKSGKITLTLAASLIP